MFVPEPEARRASCVGSMLSVLLAVKTMGTAPCLWLPHNWGLGRGGCMHRLNTFTFIEAGSDYGVDEEKTKMFSLI